MTTQTKRSTIDLDPEFHIALRLKAVQTSRSVSELINDAVLNTLANDAKNIAAFETRTAEPLIGYHEMLKRLKNHGRI